MKPYVKLIVKGEWWSDLDQTRKGRMIEKKRRRCQDKQKIKKEIKDEA